MKHAFLSASGAPAWSRCEAKVWREKDLPEETSVFAEEGTRAHEVLEGLINPVPCDQKWFDDHPAEMYDHVRKTLDYIYEQEFERIYAEQRLDISFITGEVGAMGTADVVGLKGDQITIIDLKYGMGVRVEAEGNEQLIIYGAAALKEFDLIGDIKTIKLVISQPRLNHTSEWLLTISQLSDIIDTLTTKAKRILTAEGGDHLSATQGKVQCKYCKVKLTCPERNALPLTTVIGFVDLDKEDALVHKVEAARSNIHTSNDSHLASCMEVVDAIEDWCKDIKAEAYKRLMLGEFKDSRFKLVQGRGSYQYINEEDLVKEFGDAVTTTETKVKSPYKLRTELKKNKYLLAKIEQYIIKVEGQPIVVPASDKRLAIETKLVFDPITDDDDYIDAVAGLSKDN